MWATVLFINCGLSSTGRKLDGGKRKLWVLDLHGFVVKAVVWHKLSYSYNASSKTYYYVSRYYVLLCSQGYFMTHGLLWKSVTSEPLGLSKVLLSSNKERLGRGLLVYGCRSISLLWAVLSHEYTTLTSAQSLTWTRPCWKPLFLSIHVDQRWYEEELVLKGHGVASEGWGQAWVLRCACFTLIKYVELDWLRTRCSCTCRLPNAF